MKGEENGLRILHLNSLLTGGGTDDQCVKLAHGLRSVGMDARIAGPDGREFSRVVRDLKLPFHVTPSGALARFRFILESASIIRRERIQIIHGHHGRDIWPTIFAARFSGVHPRIVLTRHLAKSPSSWPSRRFLLAQVDALIACSHFVAHVLKEGDYEPDSPVLERRARPPLSGDHSKIRVIYGGIDTDRFKPGDGSKLRTEWGLKPDDYAFAMVGGYVLPFGKGQREFLQAAAGIHQQIPQTKFLIIGRGNMADVLRSDIQRLGLEGKAWLTPYCSDMPAAMNAIDCLIHAQIGTEAMPGVVCEAQSCGRPVIASDLDGIPEALNIGGAGRLVKPGSVDALADAMRAQATFPLIPPSQQLEMHQKVCERFSISASSRHHAGFYASLLTATPGA
ncbi:MAG: glycosyltransferase [Verrucomicrobia bacterium]|jgi:glycosyltransferase involved in cell wall biosynthesis|nr:glycosyltransferase [Verrucomicrobiota bacterium]